MMNTIRDSELTKFISKSVASIESERSVTGCMQQLCEIEEGVHVMFNFFASRITQHAPEVVAHIDLDSAYFAPLLQVMKAACHESGAVLIVTYPQPNAASHGSIHTPLHAHSCFSHPIVERYITPELAFLYQSALFKSVAEGTVPQKPQHIEPETIDRDHLVRDLGEQAVRRYENIICFVFDESRQKPALHNRVTLVSKNRDGTLTITIPQEFLFDKEHL